MDLLGDMYRGAETVRAKFLVALMSAILLLFSLAAPLQAQHVTHNDTGPPAKSVTLTAKNFQFDPAIIHIKVGQKVRLFATSVDATLGIRINPFPDGATTATPPGTLLTAASSQRTFLG